MYILYFVGVLTFLAVYNFVEKSYDLNKSFFWKKTSKIDKKSDHIDKDIILNDGDTFDKIWEKSGHFEGDIILNKAQKKILAQITYDDEIPRNTIKLLSQKWPNNVLVYEIKYEDFSTAQIKIIKLAFKTISSVSCVKFRQSESEDTDVVNIEGKHFGCTSRVGLQGGAQKINLDAGFPAGTGCFSLTGIIHEVLHTLGFYHMHSNPNRDEYIKMNWDNIIPESRSMFRRVSSRLASDYGLQYDYQSIMHYAKTAFSKNGEDTIFPLQKGAVIAKEKPMSKLDIKKLNILYCS